MACRGIFGIAVVFVLVDCVLDILSKVGLEFDCRDGDTVEEENQIDAVAVMLGVVDLPNDTEDIGVIIGLKLFGIQVRFELAEFEAGVDLFEFVSEVVERALFVHHRCDMAAQRRIGVALMAGGEFVVLVGLGCPDVGNEIFGIKGERLVVAIAGTFDPLMIR